VRRAVAPSRSMLVRYEDFVSQPADTVHAIAELAGVSARLKAHPDPGKVYLDTVHTVGGDNNPSAPARSSSARKPPGALRCTRSTALPSRSCARRSWPVTATSWHPDPD